MFYTLKNKIDMLITQARVEGMIVGMFSATRTFEEQARFYARGRAADGTIVDRDAVVTMAQPGMSFHQYGLACDLVFLVNGEWSWAEGNDWPRLGELGKKLGLEWGGDFPNFPDRPHFQLTYGLPIEKALAEYQKHKRIEDVWALVIALGDKNAGLT